MVRAVEAFLLVATAVGSAYAAEASRPRGVGPEFAKYYKSKDSFTCISNPSITIPPNRVNDDFCDCPDGSDEPGTSACSHLSPFSPPQPGSLTYDNSANSTLSLPGFYCKNKGHIPQYLPFTSVNDGACDYDICCDGSDEFEGLGGIKCEDKCKEIGKEFRRLDTIRKKSLAAALKKKKALLAEAANLRTQIAAEVAEKERTIGELEAKLSQRETELTNVEKAERGKVIKSSGGKASKVDILAGLAKDRIEELREALIEVRRQRDMGFSKLMELENVLEKFHEEYNPNFNDEGVKRAVHAWEEYVARDDQPPEGYEARERDFDAISSEDSESNGINWAEWEGGVAESDVDILYSYEAYLPASVRSWVTSKLSSLRELLVENGILAPLETSGSESQAVQQARNTRDMARNELDRARSDVDSKKADLDKDYGVDDIFRALKGKCIEENTGEYTYQLCWLDRTEQISNKGGGATGMGSFSSFSTITVDEDVRADGKGLGSGERLALLYENGQHCWNGPNRQTTVILACAENDEIWRVTEEEKCIYRMDVGTPAVCESIVGGGNEAEKKQGSGKDEL